MKRFIFYFNIAGYTDGIRKGRIYATPVYNAPEYIHTAEIYKPEPIKGGDGWAVLHLTAWQAGALKAGTYLIHKGDGLVLGLSGDVPFLRVQELRSLAGYAASKYIESLFLKKIYQDEKICVLL